MLKDHIKSFSCGEINQVCVDLRLSQVIMSLDKVCEGHRHLRLTTLYDQSDTGMLISHYHIFYTTQGPGMLHFQKTNFCHFQWICQHLNDFNSCGAGCMGVSAMAQQLASM